MLRKRARAGRAGRSARRKGPRVARSPPAQRSDSFNEPGRFVPAKGQERRLSRSRSDRRAAPCSRGRTPPTATGLVASYDRRGIRRAALPEANPVGVFAHAAGDAERITRGRRLTRSTAIDAKSCLGRSSSRGNFAARARSSAMGRRWHGARSAAPDACGRLS